MEGDGRGDPPESPQALACDPSGTHVPPTLLPSNYPERSVYCMPSSLIRPSPRSGAQEKHTLKSSKEQRRPERPGQEHQAGYCSAGASPRLHSDRMEASLSLHR